MNDSELNAPNTPPPLGGTQPSSADTALLDSPAVLGHLFLAREAQPFVDERRDLLFHVRHDDECLARRQALE